MLGLGVFVGPFGVNGKQRGGGGRRRFVAQTLAPNLGPLAVDQANIGKGDERIEGGRQLGHEKKANGRERGAQGDAELNLGHINPFKID